MAGDGIDRLTSREREVLRLVPDLSSSKLIAARLGIAPESVDKTINRAMAKLGVTRRHVAAQILQDSERQASQNQDNASRLVPLSQTEPIVPERTFRPSEPATQPADRGVLEGQAVAEERALYVAPPPVHSGKLRYPIRLQLGGRNDLTTIERLFWIVAIAAGIILVSAGLVIAAGQLSDLTHRHLG